MSNTTQQIADREMGQFPISISTSLALEGAIGIYPDRPTNTPPIQQYSGLWINLKTVFRNLFNVLPTEIQDSVVVGDLADALLSEISAIEGAVQNTVGQSVTVTYYLPSYASLRKQWPKATLKHPSTPKQKIYDALMNQTLAEIVPLLDGHRVVEADIKLPGQGKVLLLTHYPVDLLSYYQFDDLALLESHTGKIKKKAEWGTKLTIKDDRMPLNAFTIQLFGDGSTLFSPYAIKYRRPIIELAKRERWTGLTTTGKIKMAISTIKDADVRTTLLELLKASSF